MYLDFSHKGFKFEGSSELASPTGAVHLRVLRHHVTWIKDLRFCPVYQTFMQKKRKTEKIPLGLLS